MKRADELLEHMRECTACLGAKVANTPYYCLRGKQLIRLTLEERHGVDE